MASPEDGYRICAGSASSAEAIRAVSPQPLSLAWLAGYLWRNLRTALPLALGDQLALWIGLRTTIALVDLSTASQSQLAGSVHVWMAIGMTLIFAVGRLYPAVGMTFRAELHRSTFLLVLLFGIAVATSAIEGAPRGEVVALAFSGTICLSLVGPARYLVRRICRSFQWWAQPVLIFGDGEAARELYRRMSSRPESGLTPVGVLGDWHGHWDRTPSNDEAELFLGPPAAAVEVLRRRRIDRSIVIVPPGGAGEGSGLLAHAEPFFPHITVVPESDCATRLIVGGERRLDRGMACEVGSRLLSPFPNFVKRVIDLFFVATVGLLLAPLVLVIAPVIYLASPGPIFFAQVRIGRDGRRFRVWKFRTMLPDAESRLEEYLQHHPQLREQWEIEHKLDRDPRVIPWVGTFLRKSSLDELPQLWNVLKGEMTLVGPRPLPEYHLKLFDEWFCRYRERVTPGITGLWQIESRNDGRPEMFIKWDSDYIRRWSLWRDIKILWKTLAVVMRGTGAS